MSAHGVLNIDQTKANIDEDPVAAEKLIAGSPQQRTENHFTSADEKFFTGFWSSTAGKWRVDYTGEEEFCHLLEGEVVLTDEKGSESRFVAGDRFTIAEGFKGTWETVKDCRKLYVIALKG
ncbi:cupin domain-containing protein [Kordiimonas gwangyangensis]|uniref:cupin domain-containing protein n=1 Tax=Kordiimonas gwangyangensis TaxID=288022 RepID=UPI0003621FCB|nr:cupin domain-containing protein [Kordiimonas gwangyangensis]